MALTQRSIDEITNDLVDVFDGLIAPKFIYRSSNNKLWLILRSIAAGVEKIVDAAFAIKNRFDPATSGDDDLESVTRLMGVRRIAGSGSLVLITVTNTTEDEVTLSPGVYQYTAVSGMVFSFELVNDVDIPASEQWQVHAISSDMGAYPVSAVSNAVIVRQDAAAVPAGLTFSIANNQELLGHAEETDAELRQRILSWDLPTLATEELRSAIRNEPNIFDAEVLINATNSPDTIGGQTLAAFQSLIVLSGAPTNRIAELVARSGVFHTKEVDPEDVLYFYHNTLVGGSLPVYWMPFSYLAYDVEVTYQYDASATDESEVETVIASLLNGLKFANVRKKYITAVDIIDLIRGKLPTGAIALAAEFEVASTPVLYVESSVVQIARLANLTFNPVVINAIAST